VASKLPFQINWGTPNLGGGITTATPELVFSAGLDGKIRALRTGNGEIQWQTETAIPSVADGWLYVLSGYSMFGQLPGNVLLAYRVE